MKNKHKTLGLVQAMSMESLTELDGKHMPVNNTTKLRDDDPTNMDPTNSNKEVVTELKPEEKVQETKPAKVFSGESGGDSDVLPEGTEGVPVDKGVSPNAGLPVVEQEPGIVGDASKSGKTGEPPISMENATLDPATTGTADNTIAGQSGTSLDTSVAPTELAGAEGKANVEAQTAPAQVPPVDQEPGSAGPASVSPEEAAALAAAAANVNTDSAAGDPGAPLPDTAAAGDMSADPTQTALDAEQQALADQAAANGGALEGEGTEGQAAPAGDGMPADADVDPTEGMVPAPTEEEVVEEISSDPLDDEQTSLEALFTSMENLEEIIDQNIAGVEQGENALQLVSDALENQGGLDATQAAMAETTMECLSIIARMEHKPVLLGKSTGFSMESYDSGSRLGTTTHSMEAIKERVGEIKNMVANAIQALIQRIKQFYVKVRDMLTNVEKGFSDALVELTDKDLVLKPVEFDDAELAGKLGSGASAEVNVKALAKGIDDAVALAVEIGKSANQRADLAASYLKSFGTGGAIENMDQFGNIKGLRSVGTGEGNVTVYQSTPLPGAVIFQAEVPQSVDNVTDLSYEMVDSGQKSTKISTAGTEDCYALIKAGVNIAKNGDIRRATEDALDSVLASAKGLEDGKQVSMTLVEMVSKPSTVISRYNAALALDVLRLVRKSMATATIANKAEGQAPAGDGAAPAAA